MPNARPLRGLNSIEAVAFVLQFNRALDQEELDSIIELQQKFGDEFSKFDSMQGVTLQVGTPAFMQQASRNGVQFQRLDESGKLLWMVRAVNNAVVVNCFEYTRWRDVWPAAQKYLTTIANAVVSDSLRVNVALLQITDKFVYDQLPEPYDVRDVFRVESSYLPANVASSGLPWFMHQGWAVGINDGMTFEGATLGNSLTVATSLLNDVLTSVIDHAGQIVFDKNHLPSGIFEDDEGADNRFMTSVFCDLLKPNNKTIVRSLLNDEQLNIIGLRG
jgi:uncharacterized protein (TIGR04255 family)